ncbi:hypothetical protein PHYBLDRAFT_170393 [Phycomyces blakesleeanus NRRL 1555(-)]|uniref:Uncharacterized protein n=1 Tax=Phycomyces blakesleeanus (strain ATCC 8743b / DSM 1359 / FGSC 10004 / NBRC 33097 / NRRL 1555) TaxID=763407 RepID=A0A163A8A5_PHYB8|nr:hypothetical protein PHYBLDRAFT_170393 [Phycomyces blakesleeanus NRRL 1555(-)]OAD71731.1 hypothetical protein PHYBLDRAFT_170393 [Phycomyces blakesleeanus NRRL 1555(-)]|eukprot:XP_018289771.1 hypothetical protein PHYBLDRAFT_170393 [Phycomyces blakesleeanus NRRL 1555(-)]
MTSAGPVCASCKQLGHSRRSNLFCPLNPRNKTLLITRKRTSNNLSTQEEYQTESSRAGASRPRVETVQNSVVLTIAEIIALFRADQYPAESSRAAASRPRVEAVQDSVVPTQPMSIDLSFTEQYIAESSRDLTAAFEALQVSAVERVLDLTTTTAITTATVISHCFSCNGIGRLRSNSLQCPNNIRHHTFVPGQLAVTHNMARRTTTPLPPTDNRGAMDVKCQFCGALMWIHGKNYTSKANNIKFSMCCRLGTVILPPFEPTPPGIAELLVWCNQR